MSEGKSIYCHLQLNLLPNTKIDINMNTNVFPCDADVAPTQPSSTATNVPLSAGNKNIWSIDWDEIYDFNPSYLFIIINPHCKIRWFCNFIVFNSYHIWYLLKLSFSSFPFWCWTWPTWKSFSHLEKSCAFIFFVLQGKILQNKFYPGFKKPLQRCKPERARERESQRESQW